MQKVKKSKKVEEPEQMQEPGKRKRKEVESSKAIAKAGYCVVFTNRTKLYYILFQDGLREEAMRAAGMNKKRPAEARVESAARVKKARLSMKS